MSSLQFDFWGTPSTLRCFCKSTAEIDQGGWVYGIRWVYPHTHSREFDLSGYVEFDLSGCLVIPKYPLVSKTRKLTIHKRENLLERGWFRGRVKGGRVEGWEGEVEEWRSRRGAGRSVGSPTFESRPEWIYEIGFKWVAEYTQIPTRANSI